MVYTIIYSPDAWRQLKKLPAKTANTIRKLIREHLSHQPDFEGSKRKRLRPNPIADWELRLGDWRVLYNIRAQEVEVVVIAIGEKRREKLFIDGEEVKL